VTSLEEIMQAAMTAPPEKREAALRLLRGNLPKPEPYLTLRELGQRLGFGATTLRRWQVPGHDLGACHRYRLSEVEAYLKSEAFMRRQAALRAERRRECDSSRFQFDDGLTRPVRRQNLQMADSKHAETYRKE
jgi:hypothetical protein